MTPEGLDRCFHAMSHQTRRAILERLSHGDASLSDLAEALPIAFNTVSKHVRVLEDAQLLRRDVQGRVHVLSVEADRLHAVEAWARNTARQWKARLEAIEHMLDETRE